MLSLVAVAALGVAYYVPVSHAASQEYLILIAIPSNASVPSCQGAVFYQGGTFEFSWYVPNGNPTRLTVTQTTDNVTVYTGLTDGGADGSLSVQPAVSILVFCLTVYAVEVEPPGPSSVVSVYGNLQYSYSAPIL